MEEIAKAIENGEKPNHFDDLLDKLLGTEMTDSDEELDQAWENRYRNGRS